MKKFGKVFAAAYAAVAFMLLFGANAHAYIDPSVMTYLIQAIAGIVIAVGAAIGIYWRKAKKKINNALGVDENKGKEVESDEIVISGDKPEDPEKAGE